MTSAASRTFPPYYLEHRERYIPEQVIKIDDRPIWVLHHLGGFSVHSILIEGPTGLVVFDTGLSSDQGKLIAAEIAKISDKPIAAIVCSHHHGDHCQGTDALVTEEQIASGEVKIYAWENFSREHVDESSRVGPVGRIRAIYQYGRLLDPEDLAYTGLGPHFNGGRLDRFVEPTHLIDRETEIEAGGVRFTLFKTGGEAASELAMHLPDHRTAIIADEVYVSLPNLYTLRGAKFRDAMAWAAASDRVLELDIDVLLGCHMPPLVGRDEIERTLLTYRDAIQFNHDQAVRHILRGATTEELRNGLITLPDHLDLDPWTRQMYGHVGGNAASQFTGYLGWFEGDSTALAPTPRPERSRRTVELMGGPDKALDAARAALDDDDPQWAAELASLVVSGFPDQAQARLVKAEALRTLGYREMNALRRNFYLTGAKELEGKIDLERINRAAFAGTAHAGSPVAAFVERLRFTIDPDRAQDQRIVMEIDLHDTGQRAVLELRHSILLVHDAHAQEEAKVSPEATLSVPHQAFGRFVVGDDSWADARSEAAISGNSAAVDAFFECFDLTLPLLTLHSR